MLNFVVRLVFTYVGFSSICLCELPHDVWIYHTMYNDLMKLDVVSYMDQVAGAIPDCLEGEDEWMYRFNFEDKFRMIGVAPQNASNEIGCNLLLKTENTSFVWEFTVNKTAEEAFDTLDTYKSNFFDENREVLCLGINYQYIGGSIASMHDRLICNWIAKLYHENGTLKKYWPRQEDVYLRPASMMVHLKRIPVTVYYEIQDLIKKGDASAVYLCREKRTGKSFAAKFRYIKWPAHLTKERIFAEIDVMKMLQFHPNLVGLHNAYENAGEIVLIVDLMNGDTLLDREKSIGSDISEEEAVHLIKQICEGVKHMHERNIVHLDLHPGNIMCQTKKPCTEVKIIDFSKSGLLDAITVDFEKGVLANANPPAWKSLERKRVGFYTDMWSLGVVTYFLICGNYPTYSGKVGGDFSKAVEESQMFREDAFNNISEEGKDFIRRLLTEDRQKRMTVHECLNHRWLTKNWTNED